MYSVTIVCIFLCMLALHIVPFTLFWLVTMSSTLPKAEWGEVYSFVRRCTKHWHAFMH